MTKTLVQFFQSYASADVKLASDLMGRFSEVSGPSARFEFQFWRDRDGIPVGGDWNQSIRNALDASDFGFLLVSPNFLTSDYIINVELDHYLSLGKPVIPVMLKPIDFKRHDLHGLQALQIFRFNDSAYSECRSHGKRDDFARELYERVEARL